MKFSSLHVDLMYSASESNSSAINIAVEVHKSGNLIGNVSERPSLAFGLLIASNLWSSAIGTAF